MKRCKGASLHIKEKSCTPRQILNLGATTAEIEGLSWTSQIQSVDSVQSRNSIDGLRP